MRSSVWYLPICYALLLIVLVVNILAKEAPNHNTSIASCDTTQPTQVDPLKSADSAFEIKLANSEANFLSNIFSTDNWPARWNCGIWTPFHGWLYIASDLMIWLAYFMIPMTLGFYLYKAHEEVPFKSVFLLFIAFILACGLTHLVDALLFWWPAYRLSAVIRFLTAIVSMGTVFALVKITPQVLKYKNPKELEKLVERLWLEVQQREAAEVELRRLNEQLEQKVEDRTADLLQSNEELKRVNDLFRSAQEAAGIGIWEIDLVTNHIFCSKGVFDLYGLQGRTSIGFEENLQYIHPDDQFEVQRLVEKAIEHGEGYDIEVRIISKQNKVIWTRVVALPVQSNGKTISLRGLLMNINPLKISQQQTEESRRVLALALEAGELGVWNWNLKDNTLEWDNYMHKLMDYPKNEFQGAFDDFVKRVHTEDLEKVNNAITAALKKDRKFNVTYRIVMRNGQVRILHSKGEVLFDNQGNPEGFIGLCINITEAKAYEETLKESEQRFRAAVDYSPIGVALVDIKGKLFKVNHALTSMLQYSEEELLNMDLHKITHPLDKDNNSKLVRKLIKGKIENFQTDRRYIRKDGKTIWIQLNVSLVKGAKKEVKYFIAQILEITERKMAEQRIQETVRQRTAQLEAMNHELEAFSYSVSHDLRSPLRSIHGFSQALLEDYAAKLDETGNDYLNRVAAASVRMGHLIDDLLALARITRQDMNTKLINISKVAQQISSNLQRDRYHNTTFIVEPGLKAHADLGLLTVALENLFENAAKYSNVRDNPKVEFGQEFIEGKQTFFIIDNGVGFDMEYADKLFGAFQRLHTAKEFEGTGIGLATVKRVIHRHGGEIWAESAVNAGSKFYFTLN